MMWGWPIYKFQMTAVLTGRIRLYVSENEKERTGERKGRVREKKEGKESQEKV